jgi:hypothetical protein
VKYCISAAFASILWGLRQTEDMLERGSTTATATTSTQEVENLRGRMLQFMDVMKEMLLMSPTQLFKEEVCISI